MAATVDAMPDRTELAATCPICEGRLGADRLYDPATGRGFHAGCAGAGAVDHAVVALLGLLALIAVPLVVVWAA
jgi:hypothetical protein